MEEIAQIVDEHLQRLIVRVSLNVVHCDADAAFQPGAMYTIVGGYRRGKVESNDVDIVFTHPEETREKGSLQKVLKTLEESGYGK